MWMSLTLLKLYWNHIWYYQLDLVSVSYGGDNGLLSSGSDFLSTLVCPSIRGNFIWELKKSAEMKDVRLFMEAQIWFSKSF